MKEELGQVRENAGILFNRTLRLTRSVQEGWDRNLAQETVIKVLKKEIQSHTHSNLLLMKTRREMIELREFVVRSLGELSSDFDTANIISTKLLTTLGAQHSHNPPSMVLSMNASFTSTLETDTSLEDSCTNIPYETPSYYHFAMTDEEMCEWYAARTESN